jgi:hypothetical protein
MQTDVDLHGGGFGGWHGYGWRVGLGRRAFVRGGYGNPGWADAGWGWGWAVAVGAQASLGPR